ncbi:hypothetical protein ACHAWF_004340 [Thalassiosira exigua]
MSSTTTTSSKPPRPCTEYNLFFQLERAYILQVLLHNDPCAGLRAFHPSQASYAGLPPLPHRYASLVLPYDWFLSGKEQRRKRKHRKSHGAIGFHELSDKISSAWKSVDVENRAYCSQVRAALMARYKAAVKERKRKEMQQGKSQDKKGGIARKKPPMPFEDVKKNDRGDRIKPGCGGFELQGMYPHENFADHISGRVEDRLRPWDVQAELPAFQLVRSESTGFRPRRNTDGMQPAKTHRREYDDVPMRNSSIASNETVDMCDNEILRIWHEVDLAASDEKRCFEDRHNSSDLPVSTAPNRSEDGKRSAMGRKSDADIQEHAPVMDKVQRMREMLHRQMLQLESLKQLPPRRLSMTARSA